MTRRTLLIISGTLAALFGAWAFVVHRYFGVDDPISVVLRALNSSGSLVGIITASAVGATVVKGYLDISGLTKVQTERDEVRARVDASHGQPAQRGLQEKAIELHTQRLQVQISGLGWRAMFAFVPGLVLCCAALAGPYTAFRLAAAHNDWRFMLGGSTLAAVLLGAGSALLRHDNKIREQIQRSQGEYLYFSRLKTGLDCASTLGDDEYRAGLKLVTAHLLAAPPVLTMAPGELSKDEEEKYSLSEAIEQLTKLLPKKEG